jgi:DNA-binding transcriptional LysR family regulator
VLHLTRGLVALPTPAPPPPEVPVYLVTPRALRRVPRVAAVIEALEAAFAQAAAATPSARRTR